MVKRQKSEKGIRFDNIRVHGFKQKLGLDRIIQFKNTCSI
jgi:hypothetical protein